MGTAVIVSAVRTAVGKAPRGALSATRPDDLAASAMKGAIERVPGLKPEDIDDILIGCAMPEAEQGMNVARVAAFRAGLPYGVPAMTLNRSTVAARPVAKDGSSWKPPVHGASFSSRWATSSAITSNVGAVITKS